jgi:alpha-1,2-mannosyltransferase
MTYAGTARWLRDRLWAGWALGAVAWSVWIGSLALGGWTRDAEGQLFGADHIAFYSAARLIREGRQAEIYNTNQVGQYQQQIVGGNWPYVMAYRNPPFYALLYLPTAGLPFPASVLVWTAVGLACFAFAIWCLRPEHPWRVAGWGFTFYPLFATVSFGQNTLLSMAVFAAVYRLLSNRRPLAAGLVAGLLWFKPQLLIGLFVWWALAPRMNAWCWAGVAVTGGVLAAVSWIAVPGASQAFVDTLRANIAYGGENAWNLHSPRAFWRMLLPGAGPAVIWALTAACALAAIGVAAWVARRTGAPVAVMFPVAVFLSLWVSPHTLIYEWALLILAAVVLWEQFPERRNAWLCVFAPAWAALAVSTPLSLLQIKFLQLPVVVQVSIPVMGFVGWRVAREWRQPARAGRAQAWATGDRAKDRGAEPDGPDCG